MNALCTISLGRNPVAPQALEGLMSTHAVSERSARMYIRFFGQEQIHLHPAPLGEMLRDVLTDLVAQHPELRHSPGIGVYVKTQTHNTPCEENWLPRLFAQVGLPHWETLTLSMTNCASGLVAAHAFTQQDLPLIILAGEKAFHSCGCRLSVGLLGEAPTAALFASRGGRPIRQTHVKHLPQFFLNPDDMRAQDRAELQGAFETGLKAFLRKIIDQDPAWFAKRPIIIPYNLNTPLLQKVMQGFGWNPDLVQNWPTNSGHTFCSDPYLNIANAAPAPERPMFVFAAGMGLTYSAIQFDAVTKTQKTQPSKET